MSLVRVAAPAVEPLTIAEVEAHLRFDSTNKEPSPSAPTAALANPAAPGNVTAGAHRYRLTFVTADGETDGGAISAVVTVANAAVNGQVALTTIPLGGSTVTARRIYRTKAGLDDYFLVASLADNATTLYTDNVADAALGVGIPTTNTTTDPFLLALLTAAREFVEGDINYALNTQTWRVTLDEFPYRDTISLQAHPVQSIDSFTYVDGSGATVPFAGYTLDKDSFPARVILNYGVAWPASRQQKNAIAITMKVGFGDTRADVPSNIKNAMKLLIAHWYENREAFVESRFALEVPFSVHALLAAYRRPAMEMA